jgi:DNA-binding transcriptional regulator YhcF (GntR family)
MPRVKPLAIAITTGDTRSVFRQVVDSIRLKISSGELGVGDRLPSVRGLALQLGINPNTISKAYAQLISEGWAVSTAGLGLFVASGENQLNRAEQERRLEMTIDHFVSEVVALRYPPDEALARAADAFEALRSRKSA